MAESAWTFSFGKFKGQDVEDIPDRYLEHLLEQEWFCEKYGHKVNVLEKELKYREQFGEHIS
jgi:uncharacterized protein (DUF3820 family)